MNEEDQKLNYYTQLHETSRNYQTDLWAIPGIFLGLQGLLLQVLVLNNNFFISRINAIILFLDGIFSFLLWLQFEKTHVWQLILQGKIDEINTHLNEQEKNNQNKYFPRISFYSSKPEDLNKQINLWEANHAKYPLSLLSRFAARQTVSSRVSIIMLSTIIISITVSVF